jgi:choline dehydrogenase
MAVHTEACAKLVSFVTSDRCPCEIRPTRRCPSLFRLISARIAALTAFGVPVVRDLNQVGQNFIHTRPCAPPFSFAPTISRRDPCQRHTNCCVTHSSGPGDGRFRDMIPIGFDHRLPGQGGLPSNRRAVTGAIFKAFDRGVHLTSLYPDQNPPGEEKHARRPM